MEDTYNVYVLRSLRNKKRYVGVTQKKVRLRLEEHNAGSNSFTRQNIPWELLYFEQNYCKSCALGREKFLKSGKGRELLDAICGSD